MDYLELCAYTKPVWWLSVNGGKQPHCLYSVRTVKSSLFTHSCRIFISLRLHLSTDSVTRCSQVCSAVGGCKRKKSLSKLFYYSAQENSDEMLLFGFFTYLTNSCSDAECLYFPLVYCMKTADSLKLFSRVCCVKRRWSAGCWAPPPQQPGSVSCSRAPQWR